jgi:hypothetical protein
MDRIWGILLAILLMVSSAAADVTIKGRVQYWNLEDAVCTSASASAAALSGACCKPARRLLVEVEFNGAITDPQTYTDNDGNFSVKVRNPYVGDWKVDVEVRAEVKLGQSGGNDIPATVWEGVTDVWPYNGQTADITAQMNSTQTLDVFIGGPQDNIREWGFGDARKNLAAFFMTQAIVDEYQFVRDRGVSAGDIKRGLSVFFPDTSSEYKPVSLMPGKAWINIRDRPLFPSQFASIGFGVGGHEVGDAWTGLRGAIQHEYAHKLMADLYPSYFTLTQLIHSGEHTVTSCSNSYLGWIEGFAEFLPAAVVNRPTIKGDRGMCENIEHVWRPNEDYGAADRLGDPTWHDDVPASGRWMNEGEAAAVLWDLYDPKGFEYFPKSVQDAVHAAGWPSTRWVQWYEGLEDSQLTHLLPWLKDHSPDCLIDEMDVYEDGYWFYWRQHCSSSTSLIYAMKAVLYNRGIGTAKRPETPPVLQVQSVDLGTNKATLLVTEQDSEDRPYLRYNVAYGMASAAPDNWQVQYSEDELLGGGTSSAQRTVTVSLPPQASWDRLVFLVHGNMTCAVATYSKPAPPSGGSTGTGGPTTQGGDAQSGTTSGTAGSSFTTAGTVSIAGWEWLRSDGARATWIFPVTGAGLPPTGQRRLQLFFNGLMTSGIGGGAGYSAPLTLVLRVPDGTTTSATLQTTNAYGAPNPALTTGEGYGISGQSQQLVGAFVSKVLAAHQVTVELLWPSGVGNAYHVAVRADSLSLRLTAASAGGGGGPQYQ